MLSPQAFETAPFLDKFQTGAIALVIVTILLLSAFFLLKYNIPRLSSYGTRSPAILSITGLVTGISGITMAVMYGSFIFLALVISGIVILIINSY